RPRTRRPALAQPPRRRVGRLHRRDGHRPLRRLQGTLRGGPAPRRPRPDRGLPALPRRLPGRPRGPLHSLPRRLPRRQPAVRRPLRRRPGLADLRLRPRRRRPRLLPRLQPPRRGPPRLRTHPRRAPPPGPHAPRRHPPRGGLLGRLPPPRRPRHRHVHRRLAARRTHPPRRRDVPHHDHPPRPPRPRSGLTHPHLTLVLCRSATVLGSRGMRVEPRVVRFSASHWLLLVGGRTVRLRP